MQFWQAQATYGGGGERRRRLETGLKLAKCRGEFLVFGSFFFSSSGDGEYSPKWEARVGTFSTLQKSRCWQHWTTIWNRSGGLEPDGWHKMGFSGGNDCHWERQLLIKGVFKDKEVDKKTQKDNEGLENEREEEQRLWWQMEEQRLTVNESSWMKWFRFPLGIIIIILSESDSHLCWWCAVLQSSGQHRGSQQVKQANDDDLPT